MRTDIELLLTRYAVDTHTRFYINWDTLELEDIKILVTEGGFGVEHELLEMDLLITTLKTEPGVEFFNWNTCRTIFHNIVTSGVLLK